MTDEMLELVAQEAGLPPAVTKARLRMGCPRTKQAMEIALSWQATGIRFETPLTAKVTIADTERMWGKAKPGVKRKPVDKTKKAGKVLFQGRITY